MVRKIQTVMGSLVAAAAVLLGAFAEKHRAAHEADGAVARWTHAEAMPFGGVMVEPHWTLELAATLDNPHALALALHEVRRVHGPDAVDVLRNRFSLVEDEDGARFDAPLMTTVDDSAGIAALAHFSEIVHSPNRGTPRGTGRDLASVAGE